MTTFTCVDVFCGAGGLSLGLGSAGLDVILGLDIDPVCIKTLDSNPRFVKHPVLQADVRSMLAGRLLEIVGLQAGELDLLAGGPPCQGFSVQRTVGSDADDRNRLVNDYGNLVLETKPRFFLMENVVGLGGKRGRMVLEQFCQRMSRANYAIHHRTINACDFGVPQRRRRVFVVGERLNTGPLTFRWPSEELHPAPTVRDAIGHLPPPPDDGSDHPNFPGHRADRLSAKNKQRLLALRQGEGRTHLPLELLADCHRMSADVIGHRNVYGRMAWEDVAPTITARFDSFTRGKFGHPQQTRTISLYEGALLQTFPAEYRFAGTKVEVARQIGNAVPPRLARVLGRAILAALDAQRAKQAS